MSAKKPKRDTCAGCRFFHVNQCRRYPPGFVAEASMGAFPRVAADYWCGEFAVTTGSPREAKAP